MQAPGLYSMADADNFEWKVLLCNVDGHTLIGKFSYEEMVGFWQRIHNSAYSDGCSCKNPKDNGVWAESDRVFHYSTRSMRSHYIERMEKPKQSKVVKPRVRAKLEVYPLRRAT